MQDVSSNSASDLSVCRARSRLRRRTLKALSIIIARCLHSRGEMIEVFSRIQDARRQSSVEGSGLPCPQRGSAGARETRPRRAGTTGYTRDRERIVVAAEPLQEIDNTAFTVPRGSRRAAAAAPDGGTGAARPFSSRRNARAARLASLCEAVVQSMRQSLGARESLLCYALPIKIVCRDH